MARFTLPRDLYHGPHALEALKTLPGKRAMICVGGGSMKRFGFLDRAEAYLKEAGMEVELFEGIEPDPSVETVMKVLPPWKSSSPTGSSQSAAAPPSTQPRHVIKYEYPDITFEDMCKVFGIPPLRRKAHFCAISSTSGTPPRSRPSRSSPITRRASSTPSPTLRSRPMSPSLTPSWPTRCPRSSSPTPAWTP